MSVTNRDKSKPVTLYAKNVIKCDLKEYEYKYFKDIIESQITENMISEKRVKVVKQVFDEFTNDEIKQEYIIVVATDVSYYLQQKLNGLLILLLGDVCIFIYKPKHLEVPKTLRLESITREEHLDQIDQFMNKIKVTNSKGLEGEKGQDVIAQITEFIALYFIKHKEHYGVRDSKFEEDFHLKVRNHMCIYSGQTYFHCFMGRKLDIMLTQDETFDKYLEIELNFSGIVPNMNSTYKLVLFNKKGSTPSVVDLAKFKLKELLAFIAMLMIFLSLVVCRDYDPELSGNHLLRDQVCPHKSELMSLALTVFISVMFQKMYNKYKERRQKKIEMAKRIKVEKVE